MPKLQTIKRSKSRTAQFRFATDILRRLGEELNPSPDQGIIELVKNSYDANARHCEIELIDTDVEGGSVRVCDDGDGMDYDAIAEGWLVCGKSEKSPKKRTRLGRVPAGDKGLGRLAALRMGDRAVLTTRPRSNKGSQFTLAIPWNEYDNVKLVDDVSLTVREVARDNGMRNGTDILIEDLRVRIGRMAVKRLARAMILLADPFGDDPTGFEPVLVAPEFEDLEELVNKRYFDDAEYHLIAEINGRGKASAAVVDWKGKKLFEASHDDLTASRGKKEYNCPAARFDLWVFILKKPSFELKRVSLSEVREWLQEIGGVHLYQNGLRVSPYGNPGNDWLDMNLRRAQSPEERPSTNTSIGRVSLNDTSDLLIQKTDRSGFIESEAFVELREFAQDALDWMARRRLDEAEKRRAKDRQTVHKKTSRAKKKLDDAIERAPKKAQKELQEAADALEKSREREVKQLRQEIQLYRTLSTAGITAATFAHESSGNPIKVITVSINTVKRRSQKQLGDQYGKTLQEPIERIVKATESLGVLGSVTLNLIDHEKRRPAKVPLHDVINGVLKTFTPFLDGREVSVETNLCPGSPYLRGSEAAVESIVTNLINNSLAAFEDSSPKERRILIRTEYDDDALKIAVLDNGPGIVDISKKDIWLPGQTTRKGGTGLGLTIVRDTVLDLGGEVDAVENSELGGAEIIVELPIIGA